MDLTPHKKLTQHEVWVRTYVGHVQTAKNVLAERPTRCHSSSRWFSPWLGASRSEKTVFNISAVTGGIRNRTVDAIQALQIKS